MIEKLCVRFSVVVVVVVAAADVAQPPYRLYPLTHSFLSLSLSVFSPLRVSTAVSVRPCP